MKNAAGFLRSLFDAAVAAADPINSLPEYLINLQISPPKGRTIVLGAGKAGGSMAKALEEFWDEHFPEKPIEGLVITRYGHSVDCKNIDIIEASHPVPDEAGVRGAERLLSLTNSLTRDDLVICLISGGASALLSLPARGISTSEKQGLTTQLLRSGATIHEINAVRKHLSAIKGGRLAKAIAPASILTFCISDVPGDELDVIGSGPTVGDPTFFADALHVLKKYNIQASANILNHLNTSGDETPKPNSEIFKNCQNILVATPQMALEAASKVAISAGITPLIIGDAIEGEARDVASVHAGIISQILRHNQPGTAPLVLLSGGETTVTVKGSGRGGRNVEFLLALATKLKERSNIHLNRVSAIACDTDGIDGTEKNAGALYLPDTIKRAYAADLSPEDYLNNNDGYTFFEKLGDLVETGPTLTNVNDFRAILVL